jgi:hypothetical protein
MRKGTEPSRGSVVCCVVLCLRACVLTEELMLMSPDPFQSRTARISASENTVFSLSASPVC